MLEEFGISLVEIEDDPCVFLSLGLDKCPFELVVEKVGNVGLRFKLYVRSIDSLSNPLEQDAAVVEDNEAVANLRLRINLLSLAMIRA